MCESGTGSDQEIQEKGLAGGNPHADAPDETPDAMSSLPENSVADGDDGLTFAALVDTRDALLKEAEDCARLLQMYDRAIASWPDASERATPPRRGLSGPAGAASVLAAPRSRSAKMLPGSWPRPGEPSIIVAMDAPAEVERPVVPASLPIEATRGRRLSAQEYAGETIRFAVVAPARRAAPLWMAGLALVLVGLTTWAWLGVSSASSGQAQALTPAVQPVVIPQPVVSTLPVVTPLEEPALAGVVGLPRVSLSRFEIEWGDTSGKKLRVAVRRAIAKMKSCFAQTPPEALELPTTLSLSLRLRETGAVKWLKGAGGHGGASAALDCVESAFLATTFPASKAGLLLNTELLFQNK